MLVDYYLSIGAAIAGVVTNNPILQSIPTAFRLVATAFPKVYSLRLSKTLNEQEQKKLDRVNLMVIKIAEDLDIGQPEHFSLTVSKDLGANVCAIGTTNSIGGPVIAIGNSFFTNFKEAPDENISEFAGKFDGLTKTDLPDFKEWTQFLEDLPNLPAKLKESINNFPDDKRLRFSELNTKFKAILSSEEFITVLCEKLANNDFREWQQLLADIPNDPEELGKYLDNCSIDKQQRIAKLAEMFQNVLSLDEMKSILAHELGHAKHHHILKSPGLMLASSIGYDVAQSMIKYAALNGPSSFYEPLAAFAGCFALAYLPWLFLGVYAISRMQEIEADGECSGEYNQGLLKFHKKCLIAELLENPAESNQAKVKRMMHAWDWKSTHPNCAKRLTLASRIDGTNLAKTSMKVTAKALMALGCLSLAQTCYNNALAIAG